MAQVNPSRIPVNCPDCGKPLGYVASASVAKVQALSPWRGWGLASVVDSAAKMLAFRCPACEEAQAPRPAPAPLPNLGL